MFNCRRITKLSWRNLRRLWHFRWSSVRLCGWGYLNQGRSAGWYFKLGHPKFKTESLPNGPRRDWWVLCVSCYNARYTTCSYFFNTSTKICTSSSSSSFYWASVANAPNVLQPYWLIVLPLDVQNLTASLLLWGSSGQRWRCLWTLLLSNVPTFTTSRLQEILAAKVGNYMGEKWPMNFAWKCPTST